MRKKGVGKIDRSTEILTTYKDVPTQAGMQIAGSPPPPSPLVAAYCPPPPSLPSPPGPSDLRERRYLYGQRCFGFRYPSPSPLLGLQITKMYRTCVVRAAVEEPPPPHTFQSKKDTIPVLPALL